METIQLYSDLNLPAQYMVSNVIKNTQPDNILKYKYVYGTWDASNWIKMFILPMSVRSVLFQGNMFKDIQGAVKVVINNNKYTKIKMLIPDLLFVVKNTIACDDLAMLYVYRINGQFDPTDLTNLSSAPLPNLYPSGQVCQSGKLSVLKMCNDSISHVLKNSFDISEYFIDMFLNSAFNSDLDSEFERTVKQLGFDTIYDYIRTASDPNKFSFLKEKFVKTNLFKANDFKKLFLKQDKSFDMRDVLSLFENDFIRMGDDHDVLYINLNSDNIFENKITIGDNIKYNGDFVKVVSFGPSVTNSNIYKNTNTFLEGHYIKYMTKSYQIGFINFSEIDNKVEFGRQIELTENDFPEGCSLDDFILSKNCYYRIMGIVKIEENDHYFYKIANRHGEFDYVDSRHTDTPYTVDCVYTRNNFESDCYSTHIVYKSYDNNIRTVKTDKIYSLEYIDKNLLISSSINNTLYIQEGSKIVSHDIDNFINVDYYKTFDIIEGGNIIYRDNTILPCLIELRTSIDQSDLYGENIDPGLYSDENIYKEINKLVDEWNKYGKISNTVMKKRGIYEPIDISIGDKFFRLPIVLSTDDKDGFCDKYLISRFLNINGKINVEFQNNSNGELVSIPLWYIAYYFIHPIYPKHSELFVSEDDNHVCYIGKCVSIKDSVYVGSNYATCAVFDRRKTFKIIDVDFSSSLTHNKFFTSNRIIYCINKNLDPFESIFDLKEEKDFSEHDPKEIILSDEYRENYYISSSSYSINNLIVPKFNQITLSLIGDTDD